MQKGTRTDDKNNSALRTKLGVELRKHRERKVKAVPPQLLERLCDEG